MKLKQQSKGARKGMPLHQFVATGGKPQDYEGCKGVTKETVPGYKGKRSK